MAIKRDILVDKLYDTRLFKTVFINKEEEERVRHEQMDILVELICDDRHKSGRNELYKFLKKESQAVDLLIRAIGEAKADKQKLVAACWEADLDCDRHLSFFTDLVLNEELNVAMEALTTIENMKGHTPAPEIDLCMKEAMEIYPEYEASPKGQLIADLIEVLRKWQE
jgi:hypothetical protein